MQHVVIALNIRVNESPNGDVQCRRCGRRGELPGGAEELLYSAAKCVYGEQMDLGLCFSSVAFTRSISPLVL